MTFNGKFVYICVYPLLTSKFTAMTQSAQTPSLPMNPKIKDIEP